MLEKGKWMTVEELALTLKVDTRTVYRYIDKIKEIEGLRNQGRSYCIKRTKPVLSSSFTEQEIDMLRNLLYKQVDKSLSDKLLSLLNKSHQERKDHEKKVANSNYFEHIRKIEKAMSKNKCIVLNDYRSRDSHIQSVIVSPVLLDYDTEQLYALKENKNRLERRCYNLDRMGGVEVLSIEARSDPEWNPNNDKDPFGFLPIRDVFVERKRVRLKMSAFAKSLLIQQFPRLIDYIKKTKSHELFGVIFIYELNISVYDIQPIARFAVGLFNEIIIDSECEAFELIKDYIETRVFTGFKNNYKIAPVSTELSKGKPKK